MTDDKRTQSVGKIQDQNDGRWTTEVRGEVLGEDHWQVLGARHDGLRTAEMQRRGLWARLNTRPPVEHEFFFKNMNFFNKPFFDGSNPVVTL